MNTHEHELMLKDEVYAIVGAALEVANVLGTGFLEAVYQEALALELCTRQIPFAAQPTIEIAYKGMKLAKCYVPDFVCYDCIIVEIKALRQLTSLEEAQLLNYLKATGKSVGVLLNFGTPKLQWKRMVFTPPDIRVDSRSFVDETDPRMHANEHEGERSAPTVRVHSRSLADEENRECTPMNTKKSGAERATRSRPFAFISG